MADTKGTTPKDVPADDAPLAASQNMDLATQHEQAAMAENQRRYDEAVAGEDKGGQVTVEDDAAAYEEALAEAETPAETPAPAPVQSSSSSSSTKSTTSSTTKE